jgi:hypothetical protein
MVEISSTTKRMTGANRSLWDFDFKVPGTNPFLLHENMEDSVCPKTFTAAIPLKEQVLIVPGKFQFSARKSNAFTTFTQIKI